MLVGILGGVQSSDTFSVQAGVNRTKAYLLFILAFTAITNSVVGAYCSYLQLRQLIPSFSALLGQLYICLRDLLRGKLAEGYNFGDALLYVTMNVYYYIYPISPYITDALVFSCVNYSIYLPI